MPLLIQEYVFNTTNNDDKIRTMIKVVYNNNDAKWK